MEQQVTNFARFYAAFNRMPCSGDREEMKRNLVRQFTWGRTDSLREVTHKEYEDLCQSVERIVNWHPDLKVYRSRVLRLMQQLGIDTSDWTRVNAFCQDKRIAGKPFARLSVDELSSLSTKLYGIRRKGGLNPSCSGGGVIPGTKIIN